MQSISVLLVSAACLVLSGEAVAGKAHTNSAISLLLHSEGINKVDTKTLVASLVEVSKGLSTEDKPLQVASNSKSEFKKTEMELRLALNKGKRTFDMATDEYQKTDAQVSSLEASLAELKGQLSTSNKDLDSLQANLKKMRADKGLLKKSASSALRQVEAVIAKTFLKESNEKHRGPSAIEKKASTLEQLSESLSFLQTEQDLDYDAEEQHEAEEQTVQKSKPVLILKADKQAVVKASSAAQRGFNEEEKKIIDLVEVERKKLQDLEDNLQDLQPAISNKLKQAMEINRTLDAANRGMQRDTELMVAEKKKCDVIKTNLAEQKKERSKVVNDVSMAAKVIESMDTALFLSRDLVGLKRSSPMFLQVSEVSAHRLDDEYRDLIPISLLQEEDGVNAGMGLEELVETYGTSAVDGPFDKVTKMIGGLIASLKAQANQEVNQHQFCQDGLGQNRRDRIAKKNGIDTLSSTIRWSKMAIVRLDDDLKYLGLEMKRLAAVQTNEAGELTTETARVGKEVKEHKLADEVITKTIVILTQLCDLKSALVQQDSATSLLQSGRMHSKVGSRFSQCKEAAGLLTEASKGVKALDKMTKDYLTAYTTISTAINGDAKSAEDARNTELKSTKSARAQRASELATANKDIKEAQKELVLIDTSKKELEHSCSHVETREEKMARRADQISALKEALNVLQGESIPA